MLVKSHFLVKIARGKFFVMDCQEIETKKKTDVNKHDEYTTSLFIIFMSISRHKFNEEKYYYLKTASITS